MGGPMKIAKQMAEVCEDRLAGMKRAAQVIAWLLLAASALAFCSRYVASTNHLLVLAATGSPYLVLIALIALCILLITRRWIETAVALIVVLALAAPTLKVLFTWPDVPKVPANGAPLIVMTFNMRLGQADAGQVLAKARHAQVQVLLLQEMTESAYEALKAAGLDATFTHSFARPEPHASGVGIFSTMPLTAEQDYPDFSNSVISAKLRIPAGPVITVFSSHLAAPWPQQAQTWRVESGRLSALLAATGGTVIDGGDFNANTSLKPFRELLGVGRMTDAAKASGEADIRTYPSNEGLLPPLIGIDHVLLRGVDAKSVDSVRIAESDHRALISSLVVPTS
jgi:endonuclease/exonuclease/phosphatase (EEP) superfamily protein YafD